jgi:integrase
MILRYLYNLAAKWKVPGGTQNPTRGSQLGQEAQCNRFLSREEAQRLVDSITVDENRTAANAILLLMLTGARRNEITQAKWEHVLWNERKLLVPLSKSGKPRWIALSTSAMSLLESIPKSRGCDHIFPSSITGRRSPSLWSPCGASGRVPAWRMGGCCGTHLRVSSSTRAYRSTSCRRCLGTPMRAPHSAKPTSPATL